VSRTVALLPSLPCVLRLDFLAKFSIKLDFASGEWYFVKTSHIRYHFATEPAQDGVSYCGLSELTPEQEGKIKEFLDTIPKPSKNPGVTGLTEYQIDIPWDKIHPLSSVATSCLRKQAAIKNEVDKMLEAEIIESLFNEWSNSMIMVKKPNGKYRFSFNFKKVNSL